jgi:hypothetical protein
MDVTAGIPISLIAVVGSKDDEEGDGGDEYAYTVWMVRILFIVGVKVFENEKECDGHEAGDSSPVDGRTIDSENEIKSKERFRVGNHFSW